MGKEIRTVQYDMELMIEAYHFQGIMQKFPNHFHEYYVIGFIEKGQRYLSCKNKEYTVEGGDLLLFNPKDNHTCEQTDGRTLDYRCLNIQPEVMEKYAYEITGISYLPYFTSQVVFHSEFTVLLKEIHRMIMNDEKDFGKEEMLLLLLEQLICEFTEYGGDLQVHEQTEEAKTICEFLEQNYMKNVTLDDLSELTGLSKYYLLRSFTKQKGISPYSYLEAIRIERSKRLLEEGAMPADVAYLTGFSDQSHLTNQFKKLIGLTPKQYRNIFKGK